MDQERPGTGITTQGITTYSAGNFAAEVRAGLSREGQKELPSKYFYDEIGSALFDVISLLPEYGLTRADERLLRRHSREIVSKIPSPVTDGARADRKSTRLNSSHRTISYAVFCLKKQKTIVDW